MYTWNSFAVNLLGLLFCFSIHFNTFTFNTMYIFCLYCWKGKQKFHCLGCRKQSPDLSDTNSTRLFFCYTSFLLRTESNSVWHLKSWHGTWPSCIHPKLQLNSVCFMESSTIIETISTRLFLSVMFLSLWFLH